MGRLVCVYPFGNPEAMLSNVEAYVFESRLEKTCAADQRLCFRFMDRTIFFFLNPKFQASTHFLWLYSLIFVFELVENPGDRFSRDVARL